MKELAEINSQLITLQEYYGPNNLYYLKAVAILEQAQKEIGKL